jgi:glycosyltransferase involved in cell wall biosynthesis
MTYDLIIVSQSTGELIEMTQNCIDSARKDNADLNIIVVETGQPYKYPWVTKIIEYNGVFNYNRVLNLGLKYAKGDVHILANNDLIFHEGWSKIGELMKLNDYHSACVLSQSHNGFERGDLVYDGYEIGKQLTGWCMFLDNYCLEKIGKLDETVSFWYSDNLYACQLQAAGIKHGLFCNCQVDHITSRTLVKQSQRVQRKYQIGEFSKFKQRERYYAQRKVIN